MDGLALHEVLRTKRNVWRLTGDIWFLGPGPDIKEPLRAFVNTSVRDELAAYQILFGDADQPGIGVHLPEEWMHTLRCP